MFSLHRLFAPFLLFCLALTLSISEVSPVQAVAPTLQLVAPSGPQSALAPLTVEVRITQAANLGAWEFDLAYDPALVAITDITVNDFFAHSANCDPAPDAFSGRCALLLGPIDENGTFSAGAVSYAPGGHPAVGATGDGVVATLHLLPKGLPGTTTLHFTSALLTDTAANAISPATSDAQLDLIASTFGGNHTIYLPVVTR